MEELCLTIYTKECCKIWRKTDLWFGKWQEEFGKFSSEHVKVSKLVFSWDPFRQSRNWLDENWHKEFGELENSKVSKIYTSMSCFWPKYIMFWLKKYRGAIFHDTRAWCKIWRKTCGLENDMRNLANFHQSTRISQNLNFHWILLCKKMYELKT